MATATQIYTHITKQPGVCGGKAAIDQTRVRVNNVVCIVRDGGTVEDVIVAYPQLTLAQVHAALAYYYDHREEIDAELEEDEHLPEHVDEINDLYRRKRAGQ